MENSNILEIQSVPREVHKNSFLKSVQWLFSYPAMGDGFVDNLQLQLTHSGFPAGKDAQSGVIASAQKDGMWLLANNTVLVLSISGQEYVNFDSFLPKITKVLEILAITGVPRITFTICIKRNYFEIEKTKDIIKEEDIINQLFSKEYIQDSQSKDSFLCRVSNCNIILLRTIQNTITKTTIELGIESVYSLSYDLTEALPVLHSLNASCYSAWHYAMSPEMIHSLD